MTTDRRLRYAVMEALAADSALVGTQIAVVARNAAITLSGRVRRDAEKSAARRAAARVPGVESVNDVLEVVDPAVQAALDAYTTHLVADALRWHTEVPSHRLRVKVANGWVALEGDVEWQFQRQAAERVVRATVPSFAISNGIRIRQRALTLTHATARAWTDGKKGGVSGSS